MIIDMYEQHVIGGQTSYNYPIVST